jgi:hypothetical protein
MDDVKLGQFISKNEERDAIHIAVAPVIATEILLPGDRIGFVAGSTERVTKKAVHIGIVDPFLEDPIGPGTKIWMLLFPYTITSLKHSWTHPAFSSHPAKERAKKWIENFADSMSMSDDYYDEDSKKMMTYEFLMSTADNYVKTGETGFVGSTDIYDGKWPEFWKNYEIVTNTQISENDRISIPFRCAC